MDTPTERDDSKAAEPEDVLEALQATERLKEASATMKDRVKHMTFEDMSSVRGLYSLPPPSGATSVEDSIESKLGSGPIVNREPGHECSITSTPTAQPLVPVNRSTRASIAKIIKVDPKLSVFTSLSAEKSKPTTQKKAHKRNPMDNTNRPTTPPNPPQYPLTFGTPTRPRTAYDSHTPGQLFYTSSPQSAEQRNRISPGKLTTAVTNTAQGDYRSRDLDHQLKTPDTSDHSDNESTHNDSYNDNDEPRERPETGIAQLSINNENEEGESCDDPMNVIDYNVSSHDLDILQGGLDTSIDSHISNNPALSIQQQLSRNTNNNKATGTLISYSDILISEAIDEVALNRPQPIFTAHGPSCEESQNKPRDSATWTNQRELSLRRPELCSATTSADRASQHMITNQQREPENVIMGRAPVLSNIAELSESRSTRSALIPHPSNPQEPTQRHSNRCDPENCGYVLKCTMNAMMEQSVAKLKKELETRIQTMDEMLNTLDSRYNRLERRGAANEKNISDLRRTEPMAKSSKPQDSDIKYAKMDGPNASNRNTTRRNIRSANTNINNQSDSDKTLPSDGEDPTANKRAKRGQDLDKTLPSDGEQPTLSTTGKSAAKTSGNRGTHKEDGKSVRKRQIFRSPHKDNTTNAQDPNKTLPSDGEVSPAFYDAREKINASRRRRQASSVSQSGSSHVTHKRNRSRSRSRSHSRERAAIVKKSKCEEVIDLRISTRLDGSSNVHGHRTVTEVTVSADNERRTHDHHHGGEHRSDTRRGRDEAATTTGGRRRIRSNSSPEPSTSHTAHRSYGPSQRQEVNETGDRTVHMCEEDASDDVVLDNVSSAAIDFDIDVDKINWNEFRW